MAMESEITPVNRLVIATNSVNVAEWPGLPAEYREPRWYAAYTSANHEKCVSEQMRVRGVEHFLPLHASIGQRKNGRVTLLRPLFPGYIFVRMALREKLRVLQIPGLARLVGFDGTPTALPEEEIEALRASMASGVRAEPHPFLTTGRRVRIKSGSLAGMEGIFLRRKGKLRVVISIELIRRSVAVDAEEADLETVC
jgi:transcription antitermination factor NusG